jgi:hypothetical protein
VGIGVSFGGPLGSIEREGVLTGGPQEARERDDARRGRRGRRGLAEFEHPLQAVDVEHLGGERDGTRVRGDN